MKSKTLLVVLFIGVIHYSFGQRVNLTTLKTENGKYLNGNNPYNGLVYELYASGFLKSESEIKNGVNNGLVKKYTDNTKSISTYQDSIKLKQYDDTLSYLSKRLFQLNKDSANYSVKIKRIFDEEIKTSEKLDEWKQKYDDGKLRGNKLEIYTELRNASFGLDASMADLKLVRSNNLYFQRERKTEKNKPVYTNILSETYTYVDGNQSGVHIIYKKGGEKDVEETLDNGKKNGPYKRYSGNKIVEEGNYVNNEKEGEWTTVNSSEKITQNYSRGKLNGAYKKYDGDDLLESGQFVEGFKSGEWKAFNRMGEIKLIENFNAGILNGPFNKYNNTDGQAKVVYKNPNDQFNCDESMLNMLKHLMFYVETIANKYLYVDIVKGGIIKIANDGYTQEEINLIDREIDRWVSFSNISNDKRSSDLIYDYGKSQDWSVRFPGKPLPKISNGLIEKGQYVDGLKNGEWNYFDNEGKLTLIQNYKLGKLDGSFKKYSSDVVIEEGTYSNGLKNGKFEFHLENGTTRIANYVNDVLSTMVISCPALSAELLKLPTCTINVFVNEDLNAQYQAIEFMIKGDNYLKQGDHENALYSYRDGIKKYKFQALFDRIVPLGDYCYEMKHSGHVQDAFEHYLLTKRDENRQNKFNVSKAKSDVVMTELYESLEEIVDDMNEVVTERKTISYSNEKNKETRNEASKNCDTYVYICNDCSKMFSSKSEPNDRTTCPEPRWMGINSPFHDGKHQWQKIGRCGSDNYYCKGCGNRISVSEKPARGTCGSKGNNCCSHNWLED